jgi:DNA polymerase
MNKDEVVFLAGEYGNLWEEFGLDTLAPGTASRRALSTALAQRLVRAPKVPDVRPAPVAPARSEPTVPRSGSLEGVREWLGDCRRCGLCAGRHKIVFGTGNPRARLMFVGEGPGAEEDRMGQPFMGKAGQLLTKIIEAMGYRREDVYIANVVKCRPPENRTPLPDEIATCRPFLLAQIQAVRPTVIIALGGVAASALTGVSEPITALRGKFHTLAGDADYPVMPTYHPAYLLRNPDAKKLVWQDVKAAKAKLAGGA